MYNQSVLSLFWFCSFKNHTKLEERHTEWVSSKPFAVKLLEAVVLQLCVTCCLPACSATPARAPPPAHPSLSAVSSTPVFDSFIKAITALDLYKYKPLSAATFCSPRNASRQDKTPLIFFLPEPTAKWTRCELQSLKKSFSGEKPLQCLKMKSM